MTSRLSIQGFISSDAVFLGVVPALWGRIRYFGVVSSRTFAAFILRGGTGDFNGKCWGKAVLVVRRWWRARVLSYFIVISSSISCLIGMPWRPIWGMAGLSLLAFVTASR